MRLIMASTDRLIFTEGSAVRARMESYGALADRIDIVAFNGPRNVKGAALKNNVFVHSAVAWKPLAVFRGLALALRLAGEDTVITAQDPFELGLWGLAASAITRAPLHVQVHIDFFSPYFRRESLRQRFQAAIAPFVLRRARAIRVVSKKIAGHLETVVGIPSDKITVAPVMSDPDGIRAVTVTTDLRKLFPEFDWIILVACRYVKQKNIPLAIEAFRRFGRNHSEAGLVIAGSGPEDENVKSLIRRKGLGRSVKVGSWTTEFASCMRTSDVFLLSSDYEGWGMTVVEAAALGKPIVMTDVGCAGEFIRHRRNGLVVPVRDVESMAAALEELCADRALSGELGRAAEEASRLVSAEDNRTAIRASWHKAQS